MSRWPFIVIAVAFVAIACTPPRPASGNFYDARRDRIVSSADQVAAWDLAYPGMGEWIPAHEHGHQIVLDLYHRTGRALWTEMPGATAVVQMEQAAQCEAEATLGHSPPWINDTLGYWDCPAELVTLVGAA